MCFSAGESQVYPELHQTSAAPALANAALIVARGCTHTYITTLQALYSTNHLPMPDFSALRTIELPPPMRTSTEKLIKIAPKEFNQEETVDFGSMEKELMVFNNDFYALAVASPTEIGDYEDWFDEDDSCPIATTPFTPKPQDHLYSTQKILRSTQTPRVTRLPQVAKRIISFTETPCKFSLQDQFFLSAVSQNKIISNSKPIRYARQSQLPSASTPTENANSPCDLSETPITATLDISVFRSSESPGNTNSNIWCSKDTSPWVSAIAQDGYSFGDFSVLSTSWLPAIGSYCQNLSRLSHQWIGSELIGQNTRHQHSLTSARLSGWTGVTTNPWFEEQPIDWLLSSPWIHNNSSSNWVIISSALSASKTKSTLGETPAEEVEKT